jgi:hypothetical protein
MGDNFEEDAFISYAHLDNIELIEGRKGWVANLYRALDVRLAQLLGNDARVWWDPKIDGNDYLEDTLVDRLARVAALVAVVSPRYVRSEWTRKELQAFCAAASRQGGLRIQDKARIFKVLKTPVPLEEHPPELRSLLGYEFFKVDPASGKVRELDEIFGPDAQRDFWLKLDDLAHDMAATLQLLYEQGGRPAENPEKDSAKAEAVYLAMTTAELRDERESIRRELEQRGYVVLPNKPLPFAAAEIEAQVREDLGRCRMSVHMVGQTYSLVPEGGRSSLVEMQYELAVERAAAGGWFSQLVWIPPGLEVADERQRRVLDALRMDPRVHVGADLLETPLEDLRTVINAWLTGTPRKTRAGAATPVCKMPQLYLIYDQRDAGTIGPWADFLFTHCEVIRPVFDGDEAEVREYHEENLRTCHGALIFYGAGNEVWLRRKLRELQKSAGYGRVGRQPVVGVCLIAPKTPDKEGFRTHEAMLLEQWDGLSPDALQPFITRLTQDADAHGSDEHEASA